MHYFITCKNEDDPIKNGGPRVATDYKYKGFFSRRSMQLTPQPVVRSG